LLSARRVGVSRTAAGMPAFSVIARGRADPMINPQQRYKAS
jgi:hypothetical protein